MNELQTRDIVVLGASAGGLEALRAVLSPLPADFPAAVFVVQHMSSTAESRFAQLLGDRTAMPVEYPTHGQRIEPGHIYVAPPDTHLTLRYGVMQVTRGAKENGHRPSVDLLFRSAARAYGPRVIGVVLTGFLDCGTAGLLSIKARAGLAMAQDPSEASAPSMPSSAIEHVDIDDVAVTSELAALLRRRVLEPAPDWPARVEPAIAVLEGDHAGGEAVLSCPSCQGVLTEAQVGAFHQFRCHVGHTFSLQSVLAEQTDETERALWSAARALEESASLAERVALRSTGELKQRFEDRQRTFRRQADLVRRILLGRSSHAQLAEADTLERAQPA